MKHSHLITAQNTPKAKTKGKQADKTPLSICVSLQKKGGKKKTQSYWEHQPTRGRRTNITQHNTHNGIKRKQSDVRNDYPHRENVFNTKINQTRQDQTRQLMLFHLDMIYISILFRKTWQKS